jgi:hypothetical protein
MNNEYIADNTVLLSGIHKQRYQALLLNQAAEGKLVSLSSMFNRSLIQKRFIMMTQFKSRKKSGLRILGLIPVLVFFFFGMACINGQKEKDAEKSEMITAVALPKMNVLYIGVNNPVTISVSGYQPEELEVTIDNGVIEGGNGEYEVRVARPGTARITVFANGEKVNQKEFRVKSVPDPVARIGQSGGGTISSDALLQAEGVDAYIPDFDFDIAFRVMSFKMTCTDPQTNAPIELDAPSAKFTESQREMIRSLSADQQILFSEIKAMGPDGSARKLPPLAYILK